MVKLQRNEVLGFLYEYENEEVLVRVNFSSLLHKIDVYWKIPNPTEEKQEELLESLKSEIEEIKRKFLKHYFN